MNDLSCTDFSVPSWIEMVDCNQFALELETLTIARIRTAIEQGVLTDSVEIVERYEGPDKEYLDRHAGSGQPTALVWCVVDDDPVPGIDELHCGFHVRILVISGQRTWGWMGLATDMSLLLCGKTPSPEATPLEHPKDRPIRLIRGYPGMALVQFRTAIKLSCIEDLYEPKVIQ